MLQFFPILALLLGFAGAADADNHKVQLLDATVCTDDLDVQHIRVSLDRDDENIWANCVEFRFLDGSGVQVDQFLVGNNPVPGTEGEIFDIGTAAWSASSGIPLDVTIPAGNTMLTDGEVCYNGLPACDEVEFCVNVTPLTCGTAGPVCGNGTVESGEQCDDGGTQAGDCCSPTCQFESAATECRASAGTCDLAEFCDGSTAICPADLFDPGLCDDGDFCNGTETCNAGSCGAGTPVDPDDGVACTDDSCDELADAVVNATNDANCDNGLFCDGAETCNAGGCGAGTPPACSGAAPFCDEAFGACAECLADVDCDTGLYCDGSETCTDGVCGSGSPPSCDGSTPYCDETLTTCVECLIHADCSGDDICDTGLCQVAPSVPAASPLQRAWLVLVLCAGGLATLRRR
jgi:cysteine-rich repeat protein